MSSQPARLSSPPARSSHRLPCYDLIDVARLTHYVLRVDRRCRLVFARRTAEPFQDEADIRACFAEVQFRLADIPRQNYHLLVDARLGPGRNDPAFERVLEEERGRLLFGYARNAALAATAAGRLQIQRFAKQDGRSVLATDDPAEAFEYLGLRPHQL
jgi:hypothetical protein